VKLFEIAKMAKTEHGFGMTSYQNDEIMLAGGMRSGNSKGDQTRLKYLIYDIEGVMSKEEFHKEQKEREVGFVELFVMDATGEIDGLVNIKINPKSRKGGYGRKVIRAILDTIDGDLKIYDIKQGAISFWNKMGIEYYSADFETRINKPRKVRTGLFGIIRK